MYGWGEWSAANYQLFVNTNSANGVFYLGDWIPSGRGWVVYDSNSYENGGGVACGIATESGNKLWRLYDNSATNRCKERYTVSNISFDTGATVAARIRTASVSANSSYNLGISNGGVGGMFVRVTGTPVALVDNTNTERGSYSLDTTVYHKYQLSVKNATTGSNSTALWRVYVDGVLRISWTGAGTDDGYDGFYAGHAGDSHRLLVFDWIIGRSDGEFSPSQWDPTNASFQRSSSPTITDDGLYTGSLTKLHCSWSSAGASEYRYAIGTRPGASDIAGWTSAGSATQITKEGLTLSENQSYYFSVEAGNGLGAWSLAANSDGISAERRSQHPRGQGFV